MSQLICNNISVGYNFKPILKNLSFCVNQGEYLSIVGENGTGKSTLMKTILGLISPIEGTVSFSDGLLKGEIGYLPQQTEVQKDFPAFVKEIVISGCQAHCGLRPFYNRKERQLAEKAMQDMQISGISKKCYRELSGGQQQRVLLARALCATRKMLLLDEPVSGLDPNVTSEMYSLINRLNKNDGITVIMITHDINAAVKYSSHILSIGESIFWGKKDEYIASSKSGVKGGGVSND